MFPTPYRIWYKGTAGAAWFCERFRSAGRLTMYVLKMGNTIGVPSHDLIRSCAVGLPTALSQNIILLAPTTIGGAVASVI